MKKGCKTRSLFIHPTWADGYYSSIISEHSLAESDHADDADSIYDVDIPGSPSVRVQRAALSTPPPDGNAPQPSHHSTEDVTTTPSRSPPTPYQSSPISVKRQRMKELAEARKSKRSRP